MADGLQAFNTKNKQKRDQHFWIQALIYETGACPKK